MKCEEVVKRLKSLANPKNVAGMARFGINSKGMLGISMYVLRKIAKELGRDHALALQLWDTGLHEARILASIVDDPALATEKQIESWVRDFDSWAVCDQVCDNLISRTRFAYAKAFEWSKREEEFVKRAGFTLMACLAVHDKQAGDATISEFFPVIERESTDARNYVKKAVNWALRNIGKRNLKLNKRAIATAKQIQKIDSPAARWIASDALRELTSDKMMERLRKSTKHPKSAKAR